MNQDLEVKLRKDIGDKFKSMKNDFVRVCKQKAKQYLDDKTQIVRRKVQQSEYESLD